MEKTILKNLVHNKEYLVATIPFIKSEFFTATATKKVFDLIKGFVSKTSKAPTKDVFDIFLSKFNGSQDTYEELEALVNYIFSASESPDTEWLIKETENWCLERSMYNSIVKGIEELENNEPNYGKIYESMKEAVSFSFDKNVGLKWLSDAELRYEMYKERTEKYPFYLDTLDKPTNGGVEAGSLIVYTAPSGHGKSIALVDIAAKSAMHGKNVLFVSLELSEKMINKRLDANILDIPINLIDSMPKKTFLNKVSVLKNKSFGEIIVKQYPPKGASSIVIRHLIEELKLKDNWTPDVLVVDYIGEMKADGAPRGSNTYTEQKYVASELRSIGVEYKIPVYTAAQVNRDGYGKTSVGMNNIADSMGVVHVSDVMLAIIQVEELEENNEALITFLKNRYGEAGHTVKIGFSKPKMKLYDTEQSNSASEEAIKNAASNSALSVIKDEANSVSTVEFSF